MVWRSTHALRHPAQHRPRTVVRGFQQEPRMTAGGGLRRRPEAIIAPSARSTRTRTCPRRASPVAVAVPWITSRTRAAVRANTPRPADRDGFNELGLSCFERWGVLPFPISRLGMDDTVSPSGCGWKNASRWSPLGVGDSARGSYGPATRRPTRKSRSPGRLHRFMQRYG